MLVVALPITKQPDSWRSESTSDAGLRFYTSPVLAAAIEVDVVTLVLVGVVSLKSIKLTLRPERTDRVMGNPRFVLASQTDHADSKSAVLAVEIPPDDGSFSH